MNQSKPAASGRRARPRLLGQSLILARRNLLHLKADPPQIVAMAIQPPVFLVVFVFVLGGAISGSPEAYLRFAVGGQLVLMAFLNAVQTASRVAHDARGIGARLRALPIARFAVIGGRVVSDTIRIVLGGVILVAVSVLLGFRFVDGAGGVLQGLALTAACGVALCTAMAFVGTVARSPDSAGPWAFLIAFPLIFVSSIFAPISSMPAWLGSLAEVNPVTQVTDAIRGLIVGGGSSGEVRNALLWIVAVTVIFGLLAAWRYRRVD